MAWIPDSKTPNGIAEVPLTAIAMEAIKSQMANSGEGAGGVADEWVTQMLRQSDAQVFKKYSQMKLQMKREALLNRRASEVAPEAADALMAAPVCTVTVQ